MLRWSARLPSRLPGTRPFRRGRNPAHVPVVGAAERVQVPPDAEDSIAVIGLSCRFPGGANSPAQYWRLLLDEIDTTGPVPPGRWPTGVDPAVARGAFLTDVAGFDAAFFGISDREAREMDPQQRLALELAWEALEDAGIPPGDLRDSDTAVYQGLKFTDYESLKLSAGIVPTAFTSTGDVGGLVANRVSHFLGLRGPSMTVNASCASALVAVHQACQAIRAGECELALAGAVQLNLVPATALALVELGVLSPDGVCRPFDARGNGYVRGEGGGTVVLKPLSAAVRDGDRVHCVIRGTATNNNGPNSHLPDTSVSGQEDLLRMACQRAGVSPGTVDYVEAHGSGTSVGDPVELTALDAVYGRDRAGEPLLVGSAKSAIGHLEAAAGMAGLIKVALALRHATVPRSLNVDQPLSILNGLAVRVARRTRTWPRSDPARPRRAGVSAFGFGGSNAHAVLEQAPAPRPPVIERSHHLVVLSARHPSALGEQVANWSRYLIEHPDSLPAVAAGSGRDRDHFAHRIAITACSTVQAAERLNSTAVSVVTGEPPKPVFLLPECDDWGGDDTLLREPAFAEAAAQCADPSSPLALQLGLAALLASWGVRPAAVIGTTAAEVLTGVGTAPGSPGPRLPWYRQESLAAARAAWDDGYRLFIELAPHPVLRGLVEDGLADLGNVNVLSALRPEVSGAASLMELLAELYQRGLEPYWPGLHPQRLVTTLPTYAFQRSRHWITDTPAVRSAQPAAPAAPVLRSATASVGSSIAGEPDASSAPARPDPPLYTEDEVRQVVLEEISAALDAPAGDIPADGNFEALGIDSRLAVELRLRLSDRLGVQISSAAVWGYPSVGKLAGYLHGLLALDDSPFRPDDTRSRAADAATEEELLAIAEGLLSAEPHRLAQH